MVSLLFTAGQKYAQVRSGRVRSGTISTLKGGLAGIDQEETWPAGLRRGKLLGGCLGQVRLG